MVRQSTKGSGKRRPHKGSNKGSNKSQNKRKSNSKKSAPKPAFSASLKLHDLGAKGDAIAIHETQTVHIPFGAPGDQALVRVIGERGRIEDLIEPSANRVEPVCRHFGDCGGCALQHISPEFTREWKLKQIRDALSREGISCLDGIGVDFESEEGVGYAFIPSPDISRNSRRRASFSVSRENGDYKIGFKARGTHRIVPLQECHILHPDLFKLYHNLSDFVDCIPDHIETFLIQINMCDGVFDLNLIGDLEAHDVSAENFEAIASKMRENPIARFSINGDILISLIDPVVNFDGIEVAVPPGAFLQASVAGQKALLEGVTDILGNANLGKTAKIADLFCGCGAFALPLSRHYRVYGADNHEEAIANLNKAYRRFSSQMLRVLDAQARDLFRQPLFPDELNDFDAIIFDPPRAGAPAQAKQMANSNVPLIIGVSCNPKTFATDARLLAKGGYTLTQVQLVDQFAYSPHIELIGKFERLDNLEV